MAAKQVDFYYDFSCPYAYLAHGPIERVAAAAGAELVYKPMLLGGVFQAIGAPPVPSMAPAKARHNALDMRRWADRWRVPLSIPETHPNRTVLALRATLASGDIARATKALFRAYWVEHRDVSQPAVVEAALTDAGLDGAAIVARAEDASIKADLRARTDEAVAAGVFGAPAFVVHAPGAGDKATDPHSRSADAELYWGQDRLHFVEAALGVGPRHLTTAAPAAAPSRFTHPTGAPRLDFFFDFSSPFAYLASTAVEALAIRTGARLVYRPFLLGALFKKIGTPDVPLFSMPEAKRRHAMHDLTRWADYRRVPLRFASRFPVNTVKPLRMVLAAPDLVRPALVAALFRAVWVDDLDLGDDATLIQVANGAGADGAALAEASRTETMRAALRSATEDAEAAGVCGAPSFAVDGMVFWGQDRMELVEEALNGWRPSCG
jgi:2-hydroxychromene-2-carboxylate isomerase